MNNSTILESLRPLIEQAELTECWLLCPGQKVLVTPKELRAENEKNNLIWNASMWKLVPLKVLQARRMQPAYEALRELEKFYVRSEMADEVEDIKVLTKRFEERLKELMPAKSPQVADKENTEETK